MKKKAAVTMLAAAMTGSMLMGGTVLADEASDLPVVKYAMPSTYDFTDVDLVEAEINKLLAERFGIQVEITYINAGSWTQQSNLLLTGDEVDVIALQQTPLATFVNNGQLLCLDDYYENSSEAFKNVWTHGELEGTKVNGSLYSITNFRNFANVYNLHLSEEIVNEMGIDVSTIKTFDDIEEILYQVQEQYPDIYPMVGQNLNFMVNGWSWDGLGDESYVGVLADCGQSTTVENLFNTDDFREFCEYTHKWYEDGLIMADILSNTERGDNLILNGKAFCHLNNDLCAAPADGIVLAEILPAWSTSNSYASLSYGINSNSSNPDAAWQFIEAVYTDSDIATLLVDGIEGTHYVKNEDGSISYPEGKDATTVTYGGAAMYFIYPNSSLTPPLSSNGATFFDDLMDFNTNATHSIATGFVFDSSEVTDEYAACVNIMNKYYYALLDGTVDPESTIEQANQELEVAGIDKIITAKQEQLDAFLASKEAE
ncbi:MAG: ABC transporter substrate-binding protein [Eubacteriales bacterium]|nr:ABC transporter substrate-binding protein [Eubacteriales bacterium]